MTKNDIVMELKDVSFTYRKNTHRTIVQDVSIAIKRGQTIALVGTSGSGKSTLLSLMGLLNEPDKGIITFRDTDTTTLSERKKDLLRATGIGFIFQHHFLLPDLTATENVHLAAMAAASRTGEKEPDKSRAIEILTSLGLEERLDALPRELSGGEQQRVAIGRAIINCPALILADEPTGNLDSESGKNVLDCLAHLQDKNDCALVIATHNGDVAENCHMKITIKDGALTEH